MMANFANLHVSPSLSLSLSLSMRARAPSKRRDAGVPVLIGIPLPGEILVRKFSRDIRVLKPVFLIR